MYNEGNRGLLIKEYTRRRCIARYLDFVQVFSGEKPAPHHLLLINKLQAIADRATKKNLMVFMPPGSAKSFYGNIFFTAWLAVSRPNVNILTTSFNTEIAEKWGRRSRSIVARQDVAGLFGTALGRSSQSVSRWELTNGASFYASGILAALTSYRADFIIIDDPVSGWEDAYSATMRAKLINAYKSDVITRLKPHGRVVLIMTRWHEDDLAGHLLATQPHLWDVVRLPMEAEEGDILGRAAGDMLWPEWFGGLADVLTEARKDRFLWTALYQQRPSPQEGSIFKGDWFRRHTSPPDGMERIVISMDTAYKSAAANDPSCALVFGLKDKQWYLLDMMHGRMEYPQLQANLAVLAERYNPTYILIEDKGSGQSLLQDLKYFSKYTVKAAQVKGDKLTRAIGVSGWVSQGNISLPKAASWLETFENEVYSYPAAKHDDIVDSLTQFCRDIIDAAPSLTYQEVMRKVYQ